MMTTIRTACAALALALSMAGALAQGLPTITSNRPLFNLRLDGTGAVSRPLWRYFDRDTPVESFGGVADGATNASASAQSSYDAAGVGGVVSYGRGTWTASTPITLDPSRSVIFETRPGAAFADATTFSNLFPGNANALAGNLWLKSIHVDGRGTTSGGYLFLSYRQQPSSSAAGYQVDMVRISGVQADPSDGASWGGVGPNINRGLVNLMLMSTIPASNTQGQVWGANIYGAILGDGGWRGVEINLDSAGSNVSGLGAARNKIGVFVTAKSGAGTAAFSFGTGGGGYGGAGLGWYHGLASDQDGLVNDTASRFLKLTNLFEVDRDGRTTIGKGVSSLYTTGVEIAPDGALWRTSASGASLLGYRVRPDATLAAGATIDTEQWRAFSSASTARTFAQQSVIAATTTDGAEDGRFIWSAMRAGALTEVLRAGSAGVTIGGGTAIKKLLSAAVALDFASIAAGDSATLTMTVTGAAANDWVYVQPSALFATSGLQWSAHVSAANTVTVRAFNPTGAAIDPAASTMRATVLQY